MESDVSGDVIDGYGTSLACFRDVDAARYSLFKVCSGYIRCSGHVS